MNRFSRLDCPISAVAIHEDQSFLTMSDVQWRKTLSINLDWVFYICWRVIPSMRKRGVIVTTASGTAHPAYFIGYSHYGALKCGVLSLMQLLVRELAPAVLVNKVSLGTTDRPMARELMKARGDAVLQAASMSRIGPPIVVADAIPFLSSDVATHMTGQAIHMNGGSYTGR